MLSLCFPRVRGARSFPFPPCFLLVETLRAAQQNPGLLALGRVITDFAPTAQENSCKEFVSFYQRNVIRYKLNGSDHSGDPLGTN